MAKSDKKDKNSSKSLQIKNKKAFRDYEMIEKVEAGISLLGTEVKSIRAGQCNLDGAYAKVKGSEVFLVGANIAAYENQGYSTHEPDRERKLLLHKSQILKIQQRIDQKGFTIVPLRVYFNARGFAKVELAVARGRKKYDDREKLKEKQFHRETNY